MIGEPVTTAEQRGEWESLMAQGEPIPTDAAIDLLEDAELAEKAVDLLNGVASALKQNGMRLVEVTDDRDDGAQFMIVDVQDDDDA